MSDLAAKLADIQARAKARKRPVPAPVVEQPKPAVAPAPVVRLPFWNHALRAAPSAAFRSALFPALGRVKRRQLWDETIFSVAGVTVSFRGEQFDQSDLDVLLEIWHRLRSLSGEVEFSENDLLVALGRQRGTSGYAWLRSAIKRLVDGTVTIVDHENEYRGHLIEGSDRDLVTKRYSLSVNAKFAILFRSAWSSLDITQRRELKTPTARSLHAYLSSHHEPGAHGVATLVGIAGLTGKNAKTTVTKALAELQEAGFLASWGIEQERVTIRKAVDK